MAALSQGKLVSMLRSAALLSPVAYVGQITSPLGRTAAETFIAEVNIRILVHVIKCK